MENLDFSPTLDEWRKVHRLFAGPHAAPSPPTSPRISWSSATSDDDADAPSQLDVTSRRRSTSKKKKSRQRLVTRLNFDECVLKPDGNRQWASPKVTRSSFSYDENDVTFRRRSQAANFDDSLRCESPILLVNKTNDVLLRKAALSINKRLDSEINSPIVIHDTDESLATKSVESLTTMGVPLCETPTAVARRNENETVSCEHCKTLTASERRYCVGSHTSIVSEGTDRTAHVSSVASSSRDVIDRTPDSAPRLAAQRTVAERLLTKRADKCHTSCRLEMSDSSQSSCRSRVTVDSPDTEKMRKLSQVLLQSLNKDTYKTVSESIKLLKSDETSSSSSPGFIEGTPEPVRSVFFNKSRDLGITALSKIDADTSKEFKPDLTENCSISAFVDQTKSSEQCRLQNSSQNIMPHDDITETAKDSKCSTSSGIIERTPEPIYFSKVSRFDTLPNATEELTVDNSSSPSIIDPTQEPVIAKKVLKQSKPTTKQREIHLPVTIDGGSGNNLTPVNLEDSCQSIGSIVENTWTSPVFKSRHSSSIRPVRNSENVLPHKGKCLSSPIIGRKVRRSIKKTSRSVNTSRESSDGIANTPILRKRPETPSDSPSIIPSTSSNTDSLRGLRRPRERHFETAPVVVSRTERSPVLGSGRKRVPRFPKKDLSQTLPASVLPMHAPSSPVLGSLMERSPVLGSGRKKRLPRYPRTDLSRTLPSSTLPSQVPLSPVLGRRLVRSSPIKGFHLPEVKSPILGSRTQKCRNGGKAKEGRRNLGRCLKFDENNMGSSEMHSSNVKHAFESDSFTNALGEDFSLTLMYSQEATLNNQTRVDSLLNAMDTQSSPVFSLKRKPVHRNVLPRKRLSMNQSETPLQLCNESETPVQLSEKDSIDPSITSKQDIDLTLTKGESLPHDIKGPSSRLPPDEATSASKLIDDTTPTARKFKIPSPKFEVDTQSPSKYNISVEVDTLNVSPVFRSSRRRRLRGTRRGLDTVSMLETSTMDISVDIQDIDSLPPDFEKPQLPRIKDVGIRKNKSRVVTDSMNISVFTQDKGTLRHKNTIDKLNVQVRNNESPVVPDSMNISVFTQDVGTLRNKTSDKLAVAPLVQSDSMVISTSTQDINSVPHNFNESNVVHKTCSRSVKNVKAFATGTMNISVTTQDFDSMPHNFLIPGEGASQNVQNVPCEEADLFIESYSSQDFSVKLHTSPVRSITTISDIPSPKSSGFNIGVCSSQSTENDELQSKSPERHHVKVDMDSAKKRKRPRKGGYADRLQKLLNRQKSTARIFQHEIAKECGNLSSRGFTAEVSKVWTEFGRVLVQCKFVDSNSELDSSEGSGNVDNQSMIMVLDFHCVSCKKIKQGTVLKIFPPWQTLTVAKISTKILLNVRNIKIISVGEDAAPVPRLTETETIVQEFTCKCLLDGDSRNCDFRLPQNGTEFLEILFPTPSVDTTAATFASSQLQSFQNIDYEGTIMELLAHNDQSVRRYIDVCVLRVFCHKSSVDNDGITWSMLGKDSRGELCIVMLTHPDSPVNYSDIVPGHHYSLSGFAITKRIHRSKSPMLWAILSNKSQFQPHLEESAPLKSALKRNAIVEHLYVYIVSPSSEVWGLKKLESEKISGPTFLRPKLAKLSEVINLPSSKNYVAFTVLVRLLHVTETCLYVTDESLTAEAEASKRYAVVLLSPLCLVPGEVAKTKGASVVLLHDLFACKGRLSVDKYSRIMARGEGREADCDWPVTVDEVVASQVKSLVLKMADVSIMSSPSELVTVNGNVVGVDDDTAYSWPSCAACGDDILVQAADGEYFCRSCARQVAVVTRMSLEVQVACADLTGGGVKVKLQEESITKLLPPSQNDKDGYELSSVLGKQIGPLLCLVLRVEMQNNKTVIVVEELPTRI